MEDETKSKSPAIGDDAPGVDPTSDATTTILDPATAAVNAAIAAATKTSFEAFSKKTPASKKKKKSKRATATAVWEKKYSSLLQFIATHKRLPVPDDARFKRTKLYDWLNYQRKELNSKETEIDETLRKDRIKRLTDLNFSFKSRIRTREDRAREDYDANILHITNYLKKYGKLPDKKEVPGIGVWLENQKRMLLNENYLEDFPNLKKDVIEQLTGLGVVFGMSNESDDVVVVGGGEGKKTVGDDTLYVVPADITDDRLHDDTTVVEVQVKEEEEEDVVVNDDDAVILKGDNV